MTLAWGHQAFSQKGPDAGENPNSAIENKDDNLKFLQDAIREEYKRPKPDLPLIADYYQRIFALNPKSQHGKTAVWESYFIRRRLGDLSGALGTLQLIYGAYKYDDTMMHPVSAEQPVNIHATADMEQADIYGKMSKSPMVKVNQMRMIPIRHPGAYVGINDGKRSYFGFVEVVVGLKIADAQVKSGQYNAAIINYRSIIKKHGEKIYGDFEGLRDIEWIVMRRFRKVIDSMPFDIIKKIVETNELAALCRRDLAKAEALFIIAMLYENRIAKYHSVDDIAQAEKCFRQIALDFNEVVYPSDRGLEAMGPRAVVRLVDLLTVRTAKYERAVLLLEELEKSVDLKTKGGRETAAYAKLHRAVIFLKFMNNFKQAFYLLENFSKDFPLVPVYPHDENNPRMLFEVAGEFLTKSENPQSSKSPKELSQ